MKKPRTDKHSSFRIYKEPYKQNEKDTLKEYIQRFLKDPEREIEIDGRVYHKVIMLEKVTIQSRGVFVLVILSTSIHAHIGDILIGENDQKYTVKGVEMMRYAEEMYPECLEIATYSISGDPEVMGDYLAVSSK